MPKGLRFFSTDYAANEFEGTPTASSRPLSALFAFDGLQSTRWISSGEGTDGNEVFLEVEFSSNKTVDSFFVENTNILDIEIQCYVSSAWVTCNSSIATITKSADLKYLFVKLDNPVLADKVKIVGSTTIESNNEKQVTLFHAFNEIGQFEYFPDFKTKINLKQNVFPTTDGRNFVIERGEVFTAKINFKSHINQHDIDLIEQLVELKEPFYIWANGGDESIFRFLFRPYRFKDLIKVSIVGDFTPKLTGNYYKAGYNNEIDIVEVI